MNTLDDARAKLFESMRVLAMRYGDHEQARATLRETQQAVAHGESDLCRLYQAYEIAAEEAGHLPPDAEPILKLPDGRLVRIDDEGAVHQLGVLQPVTEVDA